ncbi:MAG: hypothetical protein ACI8PG_005069 [Planctomycetota bacterium]|jgi:hypothetical protein
MQTHLLESAIEIQRCHTGVVIPVYFPAGGDRTQGAELLRDTAYAYTRQVEDPSSICLSVDGASHGFEVAERIAEEYGTSIVCSPANKGKLNGVRHGVASLWARKELAFFAEVDSDGDHFANELLNLVRAALHVRERSGGEVLVLGCRTSKHRPMGFLRGELEELADRILLDALYYNAARSGVPLRLEYATVLEEYPDFHSGFKLFSRGAAQAAFMEDPALCGVDEDAYFRHGCEAAMTVEALLAGARLALVNRSTFNEQPVTTFGLLNRERLVADKIIWPCKRLGVPAAFVEQWLSNHLPRLLLNTLVPQGKDELVQIRRLVLEAFSVQPGEDRAVNWGPLFL